MIAIDIETKDPNLKTKGDGSVRGDGFITSVAVARGCKTSCFHIDDPELHEILASDEDKVFHNAQYDLSWLTIGYGLEVKGKIHDTLTRQSLIEPAANAYSLDDCCLRMHVEGKNYEDTVEKWWRDHGDAKGKAIHNMDKIPFDIQARYAEQDALATLQLYARQEDKLTQLNLHKIADIERRLIPVVMRMKKNGVRIDEEARAKMAEDWQWRIIELEDDLILQSGIINTGSPAQVAHFFHNEGIRSPMVTEKGNESWDKDALNAINHPVAEKIVQIRALKTIYNTFLMGGLTQTIKGRLHTTFYPTNRDEGGTITGRFSSAHPNLQNIPSNDDEDKGGVELRKLFIPEEDHYLAAFDYKQIEYRLFAHFAIGLQAPGWQELEKAMAQGYDYHKWVLNMMGWGDRYRKIAKTLNFGVLYGMGKAKCKKSNYKMFDKARGEGQSVDEFVDWVYDTYFKTLAFVKPACRQIQTVASKRGYVTSLGGRRHDTEFGKEYKSVNKLVQGSAADILKIGLVEAEEAGVWDVLPLHLTVHDENVVSVPRTRIGREALMEMKRCMITSGTYKVPIDVDTTLGTNWFDADNEQYRRFMDEN
jgi:DNA polymerase I-like protein with 3'-5' exonuclease and polymerase domains